MSHLQEKSTVFVLSKNAELSARGPQFRVKTETETQSVPVVKALDIVADSHVRLERAALSLAAEHNIPIHYVNGRGDYYGTFSNGLGANIFLRKAQYEQRADESFVRRVAKSIVEGKRVNQEWLLRTFNKQLSLPFISGGDTLPELLGQEGKTGAMYWDKFAGLVKSDDLSFPRRSKRPPEDEINAMLSFGYTLLANRITSILLYIGLDPYLGFYHQDFYKRPALALDLMEEWRPIAVDKLVLTLVNRREFKKDDFTHDGGAVLMSPKARNEFVAKWYGWWTGKQFASSAYKQETTLSQFCEWQCRKFSKVVTRELAQYEPFAF